MNHDRLRELCRQCRTSLAFDRALVRTLAIVTFCAGLFVYDWHFILAPLHRDMTLLLLATVISFAAFYELTLRDAPSGAVLAVILAICGGAGALWLGLTLFYKPLANDHAPLLPAGDDVTGLCPAPDGGMRILHGRDQLLTTGKGTVRPFRGRRLSRPQLSA